jgi:hypothetical protein
LGIYIRKSVKAGPFRFNLSKSGLGVSAGVPGFRVGTGPRGNYVHMGRHGVYYRASVGGHQRRLSPPQPRLLSQTPQPQLPQYRPSDVVMQDITGATAMSLAPTGSGDVVEQLNAAAARYGLGWPVTIAAAVIGLLTLPYGLIVWVLSAPACWWLFQYDRARRTVVLFYDVNDKPAQWFESLVTSWGWLTGSQRLWRVVQSGSVATMYQFKVSAGASNIVKRVPAISTTAGPKHLSTNVAVPTLVAANSSLHFLPDRVLLRDGKRYSDVSYQQLRPYSTSERFIEDSGVPPADAAQVDWTWRFVNVKGGPDRRYANNRQLPVMQYGRLDLTSPQGLYWQVQVSRADAASAVASALSGAPALGSA